MPESAEPGGGSGIHLKHALAADTAIPEGFLVANRLASETSPYLLQHAENPVDWYPWGEEAFDRARAEDKPIFLSVGYSACHWCHVMEHESFENDATAALMNEHFVSVKVDREERPDVDAIYMDAVQAHDRGGRLADERLSHARTASRSTAAPTSPTSPATGCRRSRSCCCRSRSCGRHAATRWSPPVRTSPRSCAGSSLAETDSGA